MDYCLTYQVENREESIRILLDFRKNAVACVAPTPFIVF